MIVSTAVAGLMVVGEVVALHALLPERMFGDLGLIAVEGGVLTGTVAAVNVRLFRRFQPLATARERQLERLLAAENETARRLADLKAARGEIITQVAHELRTPLTIVTGTAELLLARRADLRPEQHDALAEAILRAGKRLLRLPVLLDAVMQPDDPNGLRELARTSTSAVVGSGQRY